MAKTYVNGDSSVAPKVALGIPDTTCERMKSDDDFEQLIEVLPDDLACVVSAWPQLSGSLRQAVLSIVENALRAEPRAGSTAE